MSSRLDYDELAMNIDIVGECICYLMEPRGDQPADVGVGDGQGDLRAGHNQHVASAAGAALRGSLTSTVSVFMGSSG